MEYYSAFYDHMGDFDGSLLSEIRQRKTSIIWFNFYVKSEKQNKQM